MNGDGCAYRDNVDVVERYVAGASPAAEVRAFETHLLACSDCVRAVHDASAIAAALRGHGGRAAWRRTRAVRRTVVALVATAAAAALIVLRPRGEWESLSNVVAPAFDPFTVRAAAESGSAADAGMRAYLERDYRLAAARLAEAVGRSPGAGPSFYLGVSRLMRNDPDGAAAALIAALSPPGNPYTVEAHFFLAKSMLRLDRPDSALHHLDRAARDTTSLARHARALADSVRMRLRE